MTTGSQTFGSTITVQGPWVGLYRSYYKVGAIRSKTWSGGDRTSKPTSVGELPVDKNGNILWGAFHKASLEPPQTHPQEHPYSMSAYTRHYAPVFGKAANGFPNQNEDFIQGCDQMGLGNLPVTWDSNDELAILGELREAVAGSDFNAGVALAEGGMACRMIGDNARMLAKSITKLRRGDFHGAATALRVSSRRSPPSARVKEDLSGHWLQLQYGWLPLLNDVRGGAEFLAHSLSQPIQTIVKVRKRTTTKTLSLSTWGFVGTLTKSCQYKAILSEKDVAGLSGLTDPLSVAWELLPYSFVADWFVPIGSYLSARGMASSLSGTFVKSVLLKHTQTNAAQASADGLSFVNYAGFAPWVTTKLDRTVSSGINVPLPTFKPLAKVASWQHAVNGVALLAQRFR